MEHKHESDNEDAMKSKETHMYPQLRMMLLAAIITGPVFAETTEPKVKVFAAAEDPTQKTVLVGAAWPPT